MNDVVSSRLVCQTLYCSRTNFLHTFRCRTFELDLKWAGSHTNGSLLREVHVITGSQLLGVLIGTKCERVSQHDASAILGQPLGEVVMVLHSCCQNAQRRKRSHEALGNVQFNRTHSTLAGQVARCVKPFQFSQVASLLFREGRHGIQQASLDNWCAWPVTRSPGRLDDAADIVQIR